MDNAAALRKGDDASAEEQRAAPRYFSLIRAAKLVCGQGEFLCVIRDVSSNGIGLRTFHRLPTDPTLALELQNGELFELKEVRRNGLDGSYRFMRPVPVERLINETWNFPKRQMRLNICVPLTISTLTKRAEATTFNISQQGARIECDEVFAIDQKVCVSGEGIADLRATVRWRRDSNYGLAFENTFSLQQLAMLAVNLQCPILLQDDS